MLVTQQPVRRDVPTIASYFQEINEAPLLNKDDEHDLAQRVQEGNMEARDQMVKANLRLVVAIARRFVGRGLCLSDLIQEGNLGLVHAVERFDPAQNTRFSTYAKYWVKEAIGKALEKTVGPVRVPGYANDLMMSWRRAAIDLRDELNRNPTDEEIAGRLKLSERQLAIVQKAQRISQGVARLTAQDETGTAANSLPDRGASSPDAGLCVGDEMQQVLDLLNSLSHREATILRLRFGLGGENPRTLQEVGEKLELTRERVRQIERAGLAKLRKLIDEAG